MKKQEKCWELKSKYDINTTPVTALFRRFVRQKGVPSERARGSFVFQLCPSARNSATDPRDYVYSQFGHYSAFFPNGLRVINPDYDNTVHAVYQELAIRVLEHSQTLITLNAVSHDNELKSVAKRTAPITSWVPRWDVRGTHSVIGHPGRFSASSDRGHELDSKSKFQCPVVKGARIDTIEKISDKFLAEAPTTLSPRQVRGAWCLCLGSSRNSKTWKFGGVFRYGPNDAKSSLEAFLDTLAPRAVITELAASTSSFESGLGALKDIFPAMRNELSGVHVPESTMKSNPAVWAQAAEGHAIGRRFAVTKKGHFVMAPPSVVKGDLLCVHSGARRRTCCGSIILSAATS